MKIKSGQIFNLMDTNGRRNDVINALQGYLTILDDLQNSQKMKWAAIPESLAQYEFYRRAIELSPEVFEKHEPYDRLVEELKKHSDFKDATENSNIEWIQQNLLSYQSLLYQFDKGIEDRARHYTSTLVKLGFTDKDREASPAGKLLLNPQALKKDELEAMFPIDGVNVIYLRQLLKLKLFDSAEEKYYSPFCMAIYALLKENRLSENVFFELVQGMTPYSNIGDSAIEKYVHDYQEGDVVADLAIDIPPELRASSKLSKEIFRKHYKNRKSKTAVEIYWEYYSLLFDCISNLTDLSIDMLLSYYEANRQMLNKAFGKGQNIFAQKKGIRPSPSEFVEQYESLVSSGTTKLNAYLYQQFMLSKALDQIKEYSDTTKRIFNATGIIRFDNGYVELAYKELCSCIFDLSLIRSMIFGNIKKEPHHNYSSYKKYEIGVDSYFCAATSLSQILNYQEAENNRVKNNIQKEFPDTAFEKIPAIVSDRRKKEFRDFIAATYPAARVIDILTLFTDRSNDKKIKELVSENATVPTIYEYIVGIAWYYFSGQRIDLLSSFNLTLSANFEPLVHAGGGQGDIVIYEADKVVMLEATLMNANSQKRGEWEPVLRHSINLKVEEETADTGRIVTTFFIADSFDCNTINIWKAVATVPLQSSTRKDKFTDNVVIMPVSTIELIHLMVKSADYDKIIDKVHTLFEADKVNFNLGWRDSFMKDII